MGLGVLEAARQFLELSLEFRGDRGRREVAVRSGLLQRSDTPSET